MPQAAGLSVWHSLIHPITRYFRRRRGRFLLQRFPALSGMTICDLGGSRHFWEKSELKIPPGNITIFNTSHAEVNAARANAEFEGVKVELYDGREVPAADHSFDLVVCNSVLE